MIHNRSASFPIPNRYQFLFTLAAILHDRSAPVLGMETVGNGSSQSSSARSNPRSWTREEHQRGRRTRALTSSFHNGSGISPPRHLNIKVHHQVQYRAAVRSKVLRIIPRRRECQQRTAVTESTNRWPTSTQSTHCSSHTSGTSLPSHCRYSQCALTLQGPNSLDTNAPVVQAFWKPNFQIYLVQGYQ